MPLLEAVSKVLGRFGRLADGSSSWYVRFGFIAGRSHQRQSGKSAGSSRGWQRRERRNVRPDSLKKSGSGSRWRRRTANHLDGGSRAGEWRHVWHQALRANKGLAVAFERGERVSCESEKYLRKVTQWSSPIPKTCFRMMRYFIPCFVRTGCNPGRPWDQLRRGPCGRARRRCVDGD